MKKLIIAASIVALTSLTSLVAAELLPTDVGPLVTRNIGGLTYSYCSACVTAPKNTSYNIQVSTDGTNWKTRVGVKSRNDGVTCWAVTLTQSETNHFFVRAVKQ